MIFTRFTVGLHVIAVALGAFSSTASADTVEDFYRGKTMTITVVYGAGGSYDAYSRLVAQHLSRFIPGKPNIVVKNMPGASGLTGANYLYNRAPKDGSELGMLSREIAVEQLMRPKAVKLDARKLTWIGRLSNYSGVMFVATRTGVKSIADARSKQVNAGAWGKGSSASAIPTAVNALAGTKFKIVSGYRGAGDVDLAIERGEADARISSWVAMQRKYGKQLADGKLAVLFQTGVKPNPALAGVPLLKDLATSAEGKSILSFIDSGSAIGWALSAPPGLPADRTKALRTAFNEMVASSAFLDDARKRKFEVTPITGEELTALVTDALSTPPENVARARALLGKK